MKIAVIGSGISGLSAAWLLHRDHDITVFEKDARIGGHTNTVDIDYEGVSLAVDTGFIVFNELNYPNLTALFDTLAVETRAGDMSFAFSEVGSTNEWSGISLDTVFAWRRNLLRPQFLGMLKDIQRFNKLSGQDLETGRLDEMSLGDYLSWRAFGETFRTQYLLPMGAAIWSTSPSDMLSFPAASFVQFFINHRLINTKSERPQWRTVVGGSRSYLAPLTVGFSDQIRLNSKISHVVRMGDFVRVHHEDGQHEDFDEIIFSCHSDQALALLGDASTEESSILGAIGYGPNKAYLHRDMSLMPRRRKSWASWNYMSHQSLANFQSTTCVTYWMNRLQGLDESRPVFVTLNPPEEPDPRLTFASFDYMHPMFDRGALSAQKDLDIIQGDNRTWFCGAWAGYGFHEDGLSSGLAVAERLGGRRPWSDDRNLASGRPILMVAD